MNSVCTGSGTLSHTKVVFDGTTCPVCLVWKELKQAKESNHILALKLIEASKKYDELTAHLYMDGMQ